jgi:type II secretory pathway pseudopilin PulG
VRPSVRPGAARGFSLTEALVGAFVIGIALLGVFPMISIATKGNTGDRNRINAANAARRKIEALRVLSYDNLGVGVATTSPPYLGYFESNIDKPGFTAGEDRYFLDSFELAAGVSAVRRVLIHPIDDPIDGVGGADTDDVLTDYKQVTVEVEWTENGVKRVLRQVTNVAGQPAKLLGGGGTGMDKKKEGKEAKGMGGMGMGVDSGSDPDEVGGE